MSTLALFHAAWLYWTFLERHNQPVPSRSHCAWSVLRSYPSLEQYELRKNDLFHYDFALINYPAVAVTPGGRRSRPSAVCYSCSLCLVSACFLFLLGCWIPWRQAALFQVWAEFIRYGSLFKVNVSRHPNSKNKSVGFNTRVIWRRRPSKERSFKKNLKQVIGRTFCLSHFKQVNEISSLPDEGIGNGAVLEQETTLDIFQHPVPW